MHQQIVELTNWLNSYDDNLIKRLRADKFSWQMMSVDSYEIKNNLGKIWVRDGMFLLSFNNGWSLISTLTRNEDWVQTIKGHVLEKKTALLLSTLPSHRVVDYPTFFRSLWDRILKKEAVGWSNLTEAEVIKEILPYLQKTKSEYREGKINEHFPLNEQLKEIEEELTKVKAAPEIVKLIALLET